MPTKKLILASVFQYAILAVLTYALITGIGEADTIIGIFAGLLVGIGTESIKEFPSEKE